MIVSLDALAENGRAQLMILDKTLKQLRAQLAVAKHPQLPDQRAKQQREAIVAQLSATLNTLEETFAYGGDGNRTLCGGGMGEATMMMDITTCGSGSPNGDSNNITMGGGGGGGGVVVSLEFVEEIKSQLVALQSQLASLDDYEQTKQLVRQLQQEKQQLLAQLSSTTAAAAVMTDIGNSDEDDATSANKQTAVRSSDVMDDVMADLLAAERRQVAAELEQKHRLQVQIISTKMREEMNFQLPALEERLRAEAAERSAAELAAAREQHGREMAELTARYVRLDFTVNFLSKVYAI